MVKPRNIKWTAEQIAWLQATQYGISRKELLIKLQSQFSDLDPLVNLQNINNLCKRKGWNNGSDGRFKPKCIPWIKGKKGFLNANKTSFKKGFRPHNHKPVGSERIEHRWGYILVKTAEPNIWRPKHRLIWEQNYGEVPEGHILRFLDNNPKNCEIENLICIPRSVHAPLNKESKANTGNSDINKIIILTEHLHQATNKKLGEKS